MPSNETPPQAKRKRRTGRSKKFHGIANSARQIPGAEREPFKGRPEPPEAEPYLRLPPRASLLGLPRELRDDILRYALTERARIILRPERPHRVQPSLVRVNKQLRAEGAPLFYKHDTFRLMVYGSMFPPVEHWIWRGLQNEGSRIGLSGVHSWPGTRDMLQGVWDGKIAGLEHVRWVAQMERNSKLYTELFSLARANPHWPWARTESELWDVVKAFGVHCSAWNLGLDLRHPPQTKGRKEAHMAERDAP